MTLLRNDVISDEESLLIESFAVDGYRTPDRQRTAEHAQHAVLRASAQLDECAALAALERRPVKDALRALLGVSSLVVLPVLCAVVGGALGYGGAFVRSEAIFSGVEGALVGGIIGLVAGGIFRASILRLADDRP